MLFAEMKVRNRKARQTLHVRRGTRPICFVTRYWASATSIRAARFKVPSMNWSFSTIPIAAVGRSICTIIFGKV